MTPVEIMRATDAIGTIGAAFYFHPDTLARGKAAGLDGFRFYVLGRGGVLGDVDPAVVHGAFGYFHPGLIAKMWTTASEKVAPREAARMYHECAHELGRSALADVDGLDGFVDATTQIISSIEGASLPLFTAMRAEPVPTDLPAAAMHQAMVLRELRGSVHLLALVAQGLDSAKAHAIKRPDDVTVFGYETAPDITDEDRTTWQRAEDMTDALLVPAYASLTDAQADALVAGTAAIASALGV
jgi:Helix-turn-helix family